VFSWAFSTILRETSANRRCSLGAQPREHDFVTR
jgi:hypothetical protein